MWVGVGVPAATLAIVHLCPLYVLSSGATQFG